ncbi:MAG: RluA family pseudouridine synthase [Desulfobacterales bacterium]
MTGSILESTLGPAFTIVVARAESGVRLDALLAARLASLSRSRAAALIAEGAVRVDGEVRKPGYRVREKESISGRIPTPRPPVAYRPEPIPLDALYEDADLIAVNKPAGMVVHPAPGHFSGTLVNALLSHCPDLAGIGGELRPGIVHRLDKDTSGVLVAAKTAAAQEHLAAQFQKRSVHKTYLALAWGRFSEDAGRIDLPVGRHPTARKKMSTRSRRPRTAETRWRVKERFDGATLLEVTIHTGRTHQIRVHLAAIGRPVAGDPVYGGKKKKSGTAPSQRLLAGARRQMLHAWRLGIVHPSTGRQMTFEAPLPEDFAGILERLRGSNTNAQNA